MLSIFQRFTTSKTVFRQLVVFLHGYGANGDSLIRIGEQWSEVLPYADFVSPNGLETSEKYSGNYKWFEWIDFDAANVRPGLEVSASILANNIRYWLQERNLTTQDLAIVGFSQGMMMALELMFHLRGVRAIIGYSGAFYPPAVSRLGEHMPNILLVHGDVDRGVPYSYFIDAGKKLRQLGLNPQLETRHGLDHRIDQKGIQLGGEFLKQSFQSPL